MSEPEADIIAKAISDWLEDDTPTGGIADDIVNALAAAGFIIVKVGKPQVAITDASITISNPGFVANDVILPVAGWVDLPESLKEQ